jgi:hypothetical protein
MAEAAGLLRISRRALQDLVKVHPFYYQNGKRKLFAEEDVLALRTVMREGEEKCRSNLSRRISKGAARSTQSGEHISGSAWTEVLRRARERSQPDCSKHGGTTSNVKPFPGRANPRS